MANRIPEFVCYEPPRNRDNDLENSTRSRSNVHEHSPRNGNISEFACYDEPPINGNNDSKNSPRNENSSDFDATALFEKAILDYPFEKFLEIARKNSEGRICIIGGFVYRNIIKERYPETPYEMPIDIDFLVEAHKVENIFCPRGWKSKRTSMGDLSFSKRNKYGIDLNGLVNFHSISSNSLSPDFQDFYTYNPLNIQAISYDCDKRIVEGEEAIAAIKNKRVEVNFIKEALWEADRISKKLERDFSVNDLVRRKADELGFDYTLPPGFDYEPPE